MVFGFPEELQTSFMASSISSWEGLNNSSMYVCSSVDWYSLLGSEDDVETGSEDDVETIGSGEGSWTTSLQNNIQNYEVLL